MNCKEYEILRAEGDQIQHTLEAEFPYCAFRVIVNDGGPFCAILEHGPATLDIGFSPIVSESGYRNTRYNAGKGEKLLASLMEKFVKERLGPTEDGDDEKVDDSVALIITRSINYSIKKSDVWDKVYALHLIKSSR